MQCARCLPGCQRCSANFAGFHKDQDHKDGDLCHSEKACKPSAHRLSAPACDSGTLDNAVCLLGWEWVTECSRNLVQHTGNDLGIMIEISPDSTTCLPEEFLSLLWCLQIKPSCVNSWELCNNRTLACAILFWVIHKRSLIGFCNCLFPQELTRPCLVWVLIATKIAIFKCTVHRGLWKGTKISLTCVHPLHTMHSQLSAHSLHSSISSLKSPQSSTPLQISLASQRHFPDLQTNWHSARQDQAPKWTASWDNTAIFINNHNTTQRRMGCHQRIEMKAKHSTQQVLWLIKTDVPYWCSLWSKEDMPVSLQTHWVSQVRCSLDWQNLESQSDAKDCSALCRSEGHHCLPANK